MLERKFTWVDFFVLALAKRPQQKADLRGSEWDRFRAEGAIGRAHMEFLVEASNGYESFLTAKGFDCAFHLDELLAKVTMFDFLLALEGRTLNLRDLKWQHFLYTGIFNAALTQNLITETTRGDEYELSTKGAVMLGRYIEDEMTVSIKWEEENAFHPDYHNAKAEAKKARSTYEANPTYGTI